MTTHRGHLPFLLLFFCACLGLRAQEFTVLVGAMNTIDFKQSSYAWEIDYSQDFYKNLAASITYINEGHVAGHRRDGYAVQGWGRVPFANNEFAVALGIGVYSYFDTQGLAGGLTENVHGNAPIVSFSGTAHLSERVYCRFAIHQILPAHEMKVSTATFGVGYWFGQNEKPTPGEFGHAPGEQAEITENELTVFAGQSVVNTFISPSARAYALEYRHGFIRHVDWTVSFIYEGNPEIARRSGLTAQAWAVNNFFEDRISVGIGLGPYVYIDRKNPVGAGKINPAAIAPLASLTLSGHLAEAWRLRLMVDRVASSYNRDADVFLLGLGYRW
jgi:hypothetical protein